MNADLITCPICSHVSKFSFSSRDLMFDHYERYDYYLCTDCELVFQHPTPTPDVISTFYPSNYDVYEEQSRLKKINPIRAANLKRNFGYSHLKTTMINNFLSCFSNLLAKKKFEIPYVKNGRLLDIGCGNGRFLHGMSQLGWITKGVEFNANAVEVCKKSDLDVHHGDLFSAKFDNDSFDVVNLSHVIEHVPDSKALFMEVSRILKQNGLFVVKTPNSKALGRPLFDTNWYANDVPRHLYLFSEKNLVKMGNEYNLELVSITTNTTPKIILNSLDYVNKNNKKPSKRVWWKRQLAKLYVFLANHKNQGDEIHAVFKRN